MCDKEIELIFIFEDVNILGEHEVTVVPCPWQPNAIGCPKLLPGMVGIAGILDFVRRGADSLQ